MVAAEPIEPNSFDRAALMAAPTFDSVFHAEYAAMVALAAAVSGSRAHAEDIAQESLAQLDKHWSSVVGYDRPGAWLRRVVINRALSQRRRLAREAKARFLLQRPEPTIDPAPPAVDDKVWEAVAALPGKQRAAVALHYLEDASVAYIAEVLDISPATVRVHLHRGRQTLRRRLEGGGR